MLLREPQLVDPVVGAVVALTSSCCIYIEKQSLLEINRGSVSSEQLVGELVTERTLLEPWSILDVLLEH